MRIAVFGLGYVGVVSAACLARDGHSVVGVDPNALKVDFLRQGKSPIVEPGLEPLIAAAVAAARLVAGPDAAAAVAECDVLMVCVGTPGQPNGSLDLSFVRRVVQQIGEQLAAATAYKVVVIRSTLLPGSMQSVVIPILEEASRRKAGKDFGVCINPEFLREGTAVHDYFNPPKTVIGEINRASGDVLASLYANMAAPIIRTDVETAEMVKYADNAWHALKVGFANEIGNVCKALEVDSHRVMDIFCQDTKLNLSPYYLKPGFAFGGSCLPKDLRALLYKAKTLDVALPILSAVLPSNELQIRRGIRAVTEKGQRKVGILGFSFTAGTDDLRESPVVELTEHLIGKGYDLRIYDRNVRLASIRGANRDYILNHIPHISRLMVESMDEVLRHASTIVIGNADPEFREVPRLLGEGQCVVDLARIVDSRSVRGVYEGICW
jgi:GDP-mannose 6-dehydrogenase